MEEPDRLQSMGSWRVGHDWVTPLSLFTFMHWRRKWQPTPMFLPGESQERGSLVGCRLWGRRVRHDWRDLAAAAAAAYNLRILNLILIKRIEIVQKEIELFVILQENFTQCSWEMFEISTEASIQKSFDNLFLVYTKKTLNKLSYVTVLKCNLILSLIGFSK